MHDIDGVLDRSRLDLGAVRVEFVFLPQPGLVRDALFVGVFLTFDSLWLIGFGSFLVLIFAFQAATRGSSFNRTICSLSRSPLDGEILVKQDPPMTPSDGHDVQVAVAVNVHDLRAVVVFVAGVDDVALP